MEARKQKGLLYLKGASPSSQYPQTNVLLSDKEKLSFLEELFIKTEVCCYVTVQFKQQSHCLCQENKKKS